MSKQPIAKINLISKPDDAPWANSWPEGKGYLWFDLDPAWADHARRRMNQISRINRKISNYTRFGRLYLYYYTIWMHTKEK